MKEGPSLIAPNADFQQLLSTIITHDNIIGEVSNLRYTTKYVFDFVLQLSVKIFEMDQTLLLGCDDASLSYERIVANKPHPQNLYTFLSDASSRLKFSDNLCFFRALAVIVVVNQPVVSSMKTTIVLEEEMDGGVNYLRLNELLEI